MPRGVYGNYASLSAIRRVWRAVTIAPNATMTELAKMAKVHRSTVQVALYALRDQGYVDFVPRCVGTRVVHIPFSRGRRNRTKNVWTRDASGRFVRREDTNVSTQCAGDDTGSASSSG